MFGLLHCLAAECEAHFHWLGVCTFDDVCAHALQLHLLCKCFEVGTYDVIDWLL